MKRVMVMLVAVVFCGFFFVDAVSAVPQGGKNVRAFEGVPLSEMIDSVEEVKLRKMTQISVLLSLRQQGVIVQDLTATMENILLLMERAGELGEVKLFALTVEGANNIKTQFEILKPVTKILEQALLFLEGGEDLRKVLPLMEEAAEELTGKVVPLREDLVGRIFPEIEKEANKIAERRGEK